MKNSKITADELRSYQKRSLWQEIWRNYRKSPSAMIGLIIIAIIPVTVLVMVTAGKTTQALTSRKKNKETAANDGIAE